MSLGNKDILCNTIATVALIDTYIQSRQRKFSRPVNQNKQVRKRCPETSRANSRLVQVKSSFLQKLCAYNERKG